MSSQLRQKLIQNAAIRLLAFLCLLVFGSLELTAAPRVNGKIAFTSDRDGNPEIYVMNADGTNQVRLTNNTTFDYNPTWSPDGRRIAFVGQKPSGEYAIFQMNGDGTNKAEITSLQQSYSSLSWSPDGSRIAFDDNGFNIFIVNEDGSNRQFLVTGAGPAWSPDGSKILFVGAQNGGFVGLATIEPDGTDFQVVPEGYYFSGAKWSPNGNKIVFVYDNEFNEQNISTADADGTNRQRFDGDGCPCQFTRYEPSYSPDGNKIVFIIFYSSYDAEIIVKNVDGTGFTQLTNTVGSNSSPSWQPLQLADAVSVSGRVTTPDGRGLRNATVSITAANSVRRTVTTSSFGFYSFDNVATGGTYTMGVQSKLYRFSSRSVTAVNDTLTNIDFVGLE